MRSLKLWYSNLLAIVKIVSTFSPVLAEVSIKKGILCLALKASAFSSDTSLLCSLSFWLPIKITITSGSL